MFGSANSAPPPTNNQYNDLTGILGDLSQEMFLSIQLPSANDPFEIDQATDIATNNNTQNDNPQNNAACCCKLIQKVLNKVSYVHKTVSKDVSALRHEVAQNRKLLLKLVSTECVSETNTEENANDSEVIEGEPPQLNVAEIEQFNEKYKAMFPFKDCPALIDFNASMRSDQKFVDDLYSKFKQIKGLDEVKTARKLLKELCDFRCLKDFTWFGTKIIRNVMHLMLLRKSLNSARKVRRKLLKKVSNEALPRRLDKYKSQWKLLTLIRRALKLGLKFQQIIRLMM